MANEERVLPEATVNESTSMEAFKRLDNHILIVSSSLSLNTIEDIWCVLLPPEVSEVCAWGVCLSGVG